MPRQELVSSGKRGMLGGMGNSPQRDLRSAGGGEPRGKGDPRGKTTGRAFSPWNEFRRQIVRYSQRESKKRGAVIELTSTYARQELVNGLICNI